MSRMSKIMESVLKHKEYKERSSDVNKTDEHIKARSLVEDEIYELPKRVYLTHVKNELKFGCQVLIFNESEDTESIILYVHGGAYVEEIENMHVAFCDKLAKKANATVFVPIYPLAPNHTYKETYQIVEKLYEDMLKSNKPIAIMGDSTGGGFSAAFCEYLAENELAQPKHLVLISPWVDVSMSGDYDDYVELDPMLGVDGLREMGKAWVGDLDSKDYKVSPLYGDVKKLPQTAIFVGTHEVLYLDIIEFYNKLKDNGIDVELNIGEAMSHVYPLYPLVPEAKEAFNHIVDIILEK